MSADVVSGAVKVAGPRGTRGLTVVAQGAVAGVMALLTVTFWMLYEFRRLEVFQPLEDAAMLYRYAVNLAVGGGVAWNPGEAPGLTDGATDLGFVLLLAPLIAAGLSAAAGGLLINGFGVLAVGAVLGAANALVWRLPLWLLLGIVGLVASGPLYLYVVSGFSPAVFGAGLAVLFLLAVGAQRRGTAVLLVVTGLAAGLLGWWRPEGFVLAPLVVASALLVGSARPTPATHLRRRRWWLAVGAFGVVALGWVAIRLMYFGQLLPTSAVLKADGLHPANVLFSLQFLTALTLPVLVMLLARSFGGSARAWVAVTALLVLSLAWLPLVASEDRWDDNWPGAWRIAGVASVLILVPLLTVVAVRAWRSSSRGWVPIALVGVSSLLWMFVATALNWWGRMQWPLVPVLVMVALTVLVAEAPEDARGDLAARMLPSSFRQQWLPFLCVAGLTFVSVGAGHTPLAVLWGKAPFSTAVADALAHVDTAGVRLATTEAGLVPLAVQGRALDTYGHNNRAIAASDGAALEAELDALRPNVLAVHGATPAQVTDVACSGEQLFGADWARQGTELYAYAAHHGMELLRVTESAPCDAWSIFVAPDVPQPVREALLGYHMRGRELR